MRCAHIESGISFTPPSSLPTPFLCPARFAASLLQSHRTPLRSSPFHKSMKDNVVALSASFFHVQDIADWCQPIQRVRCVHRTLLGRCSGERSSANRWIDEHASMRGPANVTTAAAVFVQFTKRSNTHGRTRLRLARLEIASAFYRVRFREFWSRGPAASRTPKPNRRPGAGCLVPAHSPTPAKLWQII